MMDRKPWENRDSHREGFGGRREWNSDRSDRRFGEDRPRFNREDRFGNDRPRFNREDGFGDDPPRFNRENRYEGGDRRFGEDPAIISGIGTLSGRPVTYIAIDKGADLDSRMRNHFGCPMPEGYRKALRLMKQAEKFDRPIITFIDTPGAYPGKDAEERGQGEAIARNLMEMSGLTVPVIAVVTGEGSSGGALALGVANRILMLENAVYSVLSPEGFASILWKDSSRSGEACEIMKLTAQDLYKDGIVEEIIPEPVGGAQRAPGVLFGDLDEALRRQLRSLARMNGRQLAEQRYQKFRQIGEMRKA